MLAIILKGDLGNQMFQCAFGRCIALLLHTELFLEIGINLSGNSNRLFDLDIFKIPPEVHIGSLVELKILISPNLILSPKILFF